jgi:hypothetical protein
VTCLSVRDERSIEPSLLVPVSDSSNNKKRASEGVVAEGGEGASDGLEQENKRLRAQLEAAERAQEAAERAQAEECALREEAELARIKVSRARLLAEGVTVTVAADASESHVGGGSHDDASVVAYSGALAVVADMCDRVGVFGRAGATLQQSSMRGINCHRRSKRVRFA